MSDRIAAYKRLRNKGGYGAKTAWQIAGMATPKYDWHAARGGGGLSIVQADFEQDGLDVRAVVSYDQWVDPKVSDTDVNTGIRNPRFRYSEDGYYGRNRDQKYLELECGNTIVELAKYYNGKGGMSKNVAWETARQALQDEAENYLSDQYTEYVIDVTVHLNGMELGRASIGGYEPSEFQSAEDVGDDAISGNGLVEEAMGEARERLAELKPAIERVLATV